MAQNIRDKRMLITGASKGLGKTAAIAFEQERPCLKQKSWWINILIERIFGVLS